MTVESNYATSIATLSDWLKPTPVFQPMASKAKTDHTIQSSFQMTVESNYVIAIATVSDWLKRLALVFQPMRSKAKTNRTMYA